MSTQVGARQYPRHVFDDIGDIPEPQSSRLREIYELIESIREKKLVMAIVAFFASALLIIGGYLFLVLADLIRDFMTLNVKPRLTFVLAVCLLVIGVYLFTLWRQMRRNCRILIQQLSFVIRSSAHAKQDIGLLTTFDPEVKYVIKSWVPGF